MICLQDIGLARSMGCTTAVAKTEEVEGVEAVFVTRRRPNCGQPTIWVCEWLDTHSSGRSEYMLGAACAFHHESIVSGELPLFDSAHQLVKPDWYKLPEDPAEDRQWVADLIAAANPEREAASD